ncbi:unnamed protein product [Cunninghamella blakesleeana]
MVWNPFKRYFAFIRFINKCYMKIDHPIYLLHKQNSYKLTQYINEHPLDLLKTIKYISTKTIRDINNDQKRLILVSFQLINHLLQSFHQQLDIYLYDLCLMIKSGLGTFDSSINEISLDTFALICKYINPVTSNQIYHFNDLIKYCSKMANGRLGGGDLKTILTGLKALTFLLSTNWFSTLDSIYYRQYIIQAALWNIYSSVLSDLNFAIDYSTSNFTIPSISLSNDTDDDYRHHHHIDQEPENLSLVIIRQCCQSDNDVLISVFIRSALKFIDQQKSWWPPEKNILLFNKITYVINGKYRYLMIDYLLIQLETSLLQLYDLEQGAGLASIITSLLSDNQFSLKKIKSTTNNSSNDPFSIHLIDRHHQEELEEDDENDLLLQKYHNTLFIMMRKFILSNYYIQLNHQSMKLQKKSDMSIHFLSQLNTIIQRRIIICIGSITNRYKKEKSFIDALSLITKIFNTAIHLEQVANFNSKSLYLFIIQSIISIIKQNQRKKWYEILYPWFKKNRSFIKHPDIDIRIGYGQSILYFIKSQQQEYQKQACELLHSLHQDIIDSIKQSYYSLVDTLFLYGLLLLAVMTEKESANLDQKKSNSNIILCHLPFVLKLQSICQYNSILPRWLRIVLASIIVQWLALVAQSFQMDILSNYLKEIVIKRKHVSCWYPISFINIDSLTLPQNEMNRRIVNLNQIKGTDEEMVHWLQLDYNWILNTFHLNNEDEDSFHHFLHVSRNLDDKFNPIQLYFNVEQENETDEIRCHP